MRPSLFRIVRWRRILAALALVTLLAVLLSLVVLAQGPSPSPLPDRLLSGGDPRSEGGGPGLVGSPLGVLLGVVALGIATALVTALLARFARRA